MTTYCLQTILRTNRSIVTKDLQKLLCEQINVEYSLKLYKIICGMLDLLKNGSFICSLPYNVCYFCDLLRKRGGKKASLHPQINAEQSAY